MATKKEVDEKALHAFRNVVQFEKAINANIPPVQIVVMITRFWDLMGDEAMIDLSNYIKWSQLYNEDIMRTSATVGHDLNGAGSRCFLPRSNNYTQHLADYFAGVKDAQKVLTRKV